MANEIWVLGAAGRSGREIAARLRAADVPLVLAGRDAARLDELAVRIGGAPRTVVGDLTAVLPRLAAEAPSVVVNTVGPFETTAALVARALPAGTHYVDISNEYPAVEAILALGGRAAAAGQTFVAASGFGVLAAESALLHLLGGLPAPERVRVDAMASVASEAGAVGAALAGSIVEAVAFGGGQVRGGRLVRMRLGTEPERLTTPDGDVVTTVSGVSGELLAAWRASGADTVVSASSLAPDSALLRFVSPALAAALRVPAVARFLAGRLAGVSMTARPAPRASSWARARAEWASGEVREAWLRIPDAMHFTTSATAEVALRLHKGEGRPGSYTPGALFGPELAEALGGEYV